MTESIREFVLPDLGEGLEEATVVNWEVGVGDPVDLNQVICVVETAKAEVDVPSPYAGTVVELGGDVGETLPVGELLIRIDTSAGSASTPTGPAAAASADVASSKPEPTLVGTGFDESLDRSRRSRRTGASTSGTPVAPARSTSLLTTDTAEGPATKPLAKPPVRQLAKDLDVDLASISPGSGPGGIVTRRDVLAAAGSNEHCSAAVAARAPATGEMIPVSGVRARIAERMTTSRREIPDASCSVVADATRLLEVRRTLNDHAERLGFAPVITPFSLLGRFVVQALQATPMLNARWDDQGPSIEVFGSIDLGIGTATERGLVVTVVHDAGRLDVHALSVEMARLVRAARDGSLVPTELQGSTFTISNFGALGLDEGIPVINHPEAAILGVGSIKPRPHVIEGEIVARPTVTITLAFDHRICDGAEAARFLRDLVTAIEAPETSLLLP